MAQLWWYLAPPSPYQLKKHHSWTPSDKTLDPHMVVDPWRCQNVSYHNEQDCSKWYTIANIHFFNFDETFAAHYTVWPMNLQSLNLLRPRVYRRCIYKKILFYKLLNFLLGRMKCCPVPLKSCDLCTCKVWSCYIQWFRRCIYKKIHKILPNTLYIMTDLCTCKVWSCKVQRFRRK